MAAIRTHAAAVSCALVILAGLSPAGALELWRSDDGSSAASVDLSLKWTSVLSRAPEDRLLYPERWSAESLWRGRLTGRLRGSDWFSMELAYENRLRLVSEDAGLAAGSGLSTSLGRAPYRISQLDEELVAVGSTLSYGHELDRAFVTLTPGALDMRVGRQAVGLGRGVLFGAVDLFAPFSALEVDREWRRGVDAVRLGTRVGNAFYVEGMAVLGETSEESCYLLRASGRVSDLDAELVAGTRCQDAVVGVSASCPLLEAEVHAEVAAFGLPEPLPGDTAFGLDETVFTAVLGCSYVFDLGDGLMAVAEYHYSGFGADDIADGMEWFLHPAFVERYARGDVSIVGRHAAAVQLTYGLAGTAPLGLTWVASPNDGSGVVMPSLTWLFSDSVTLTAAASFPHGPAVDGGWLESEYGGTPSSVLLQLSFYN